ncbi:unnamed protein product [Caenorhabditis auriculariae]|uniref:Uncharacterized protein n=1 Tax=Caenorhabditis auriculariae TaxID=2777116 RepID=A0A8S1GZT1_9PELO|nr:unnamed protein product [Caenorhabditis auriculariae]
MVPGAAPPEKSTGGGDFAAAGDPSTTTISTIAVRAGVNASIVVALLKSAGYIELRVDEMRPKLLAIGNSAEETSGLLHIHEDLLARLREKDDQVQALLSRADSLSGEKKDPKEAVVYEEMAKSMHQYNFHKPQRNPNEMRSTCFRRTQFLRFSCTWTLENSYESDANDRSNRILSYLLRETLHFHQMAESHELLTSKTAQILGQLNALNGEKLVPAIDQLINDIIDTTAAAVELGTSVISQIRTLGQIDDNPERPKEILEACVLVETIMLRIATEWEKAESSWQKARQQPLHATTTEIDELTIIEQWLTYSEKRLKALNDSGQKQILNEGNKHVARLRDLSTSQSEADTGRISHLSGRIEEFLHYLKTRMNRSQRIQAFIQAAKSMLSQLSMMAADMKNASAAISGELAPLAKQKALPLISEGKDIAAKEVLNYEEQRLVRQLCEDLERGLEEIEQLSKQRHASQQVNQEIQDIRSWLDGQATAFLAQRGDMGGNLTDAREFVAVHKNFATDVINRDASVMTIHAKRSQMTSDDEKFLEVFIKDYEKMKDVLENRIQLGTTYEQVHKFAKELEGSFDALQTLLENNQEFTNEKIAAQIANVFQMIQETLSQEKHQGEKFISNATQIGKGDEWLNVERAQEAIRNLITDHENRFKYVSHKWNEWQRNKNSETTVERTIEEIQMWQEDVLEYVAKIDRSSFTTKQESEQAHQKLQAFREAAAEHSKRLDTLKTETNNDEQLSRISVTVDKQDYIKNRIEEVLNKLELRTLLRVIEDVQIWQEEAIEIIRSVDHVVSTTNTTDQQIHELRRRVEELNDETIKKSQFLEESKSLSQNEIFQRELQETITRQEQIKQTIEQLDSKVGGYLLEGNSLC